MQRLRIFSPRALLPLLWLLPSLLLWGGGLAALDSFLLPPSWPDHLRVVVWPDRLRSALFVLSLVVVPVLGAWAYRCQGRRLSASRGLAWMAAPMPLLLLPLLLLPFFFWTLLPGSLPANLLFYGTVALATLVLFRFLHLPRCSGCHAPRSMAPGTGTGRKPGIYHSRSVLFLVTAVTCLFFLFFWLGGIYFGSWVGEKGGDAGHFIIQAESVYYDHDLDIGNNFDAMEQKVLHQRGPAIMHISPNARNGHVYSWHSFGLSLLLAPLVPFGPAGLHAVTAIIAALGIGGALLACLLLGVSRRTSLVVTVLFALSVFWATYAFQILPECAGATGMVWILVAILLLPRCPGLAWTLMVVVCLALPWLYVRFAPPAAMGAIFFLLALWQSGLSRRQRYTLALSFLLVCLCGGALYFLVQFSMFEGGYASPNDSRMLFSYLPGMWKILFSERSVTYVLPLFPVMLLSTGRILFYEPEHRFAAAFALTVFLTVLATSCSFPTWFGGAVMPGRYLLVATLVLLPFAAREYEQAGPVVRWFFLFLGLVSCGYFLLLLINLPEIGIHFGDPRRILAFYRPLLDGLANPFARPADLFGFLLFFLTGVMIFSPPRAVRLHAAALFCLVAAVVWLHQPDRDYVNSPWRRTVLNDSMRRRNSAMFRHVDTGKSLVFLPGTRSYPVSSVFAGRLAVVRGGEPLQDAVLVRQLGEHGAGSLQAGRRWVRLVRDFSDGPGPRTLCVAGVQGSGGGVAVVGDFAGSRKVLLAPQESVAGTDRAAACHDMVLPGQGAIQVLFACPGRDRSCSLPDLFWYPLTLSFFQQARLSPPVDPR